MARSSVTSPTLGRKRSESVLLFDRKCFETGGIQLFRQSQVGLDIGISKVRIVSLLKKRGGVELLRYGSINIPAKIMENGTILDPAGLGDAIGTMVEDLGLAGTRAILAVPGHQVYMRAITMPCLRPNELRTAAYYKASEFLPIPIHDTVMDIFPCRRFRDHTGKKIEIFLAAVRRQQVENLAMVCRQAGLKPAAIETEPLSLWRAWGGEGRNPVGLLAISALRPYLAIFNYGIPVFYRSLANSNAINYSVYWDDPMLADNISPLEKITDEIKNGLRYFENQNEDNNRVNRIILHGASTMPGLDVNLEQGLGLQTETVGERAWDKISLPSGVDNQARSALQLEFSLALGLAARGLWR